MLGSADSLSILTFGVFEQSPPASERNPCSGGTHDPPFRTASTCFCRPHAFRLKGLLHRGPQYHLEAHGREYAANAAPTEISPAISGKRPSDNYLQQLYHPYA